MSSRIDPFAKMRERHFRWKPAKSKIITPRGQEHEEFRLYGQPLENVPMFTYLGIKFDCRGINMEAQVTHNINKGKGTASVLRSMGCYLGGLDPFLVATLYKSTIRSQLEYGLAICPLPRALMQRLVAMEKTTLSQFYGTAKWSGQEILYSLLEAPPIDDHITALNSAWLARISLAASDCLISQVLPVACAIPTSFISKCREQNSPWTQAAPVFQALDVTDGCTKDDLQAAHTQLRAANTAYQDQQKAGRRAGSGHALANNVPPRALLRLSKCAKMPRIWTLLYWFNRMPPYGVECEACGNGKTVSRRHIQDDCLL
ncbi:unnamed protein product [Mortierella alpina]